MVVLIVVGAVVGIIVGVFVASEFRSIAAMKGHDEAKYFWWTLLLGPVGMLMVVALPQKADAFAPHDPSTLTEKALPDELPDI